ncbi:LexA family protein [Spirosoma sordidisoli]|uniref:Translesion error-prone DNA polymerase V autoproteolytic subunit n=1 Tax=Spirosoma sordidisoli TaxID=2502893 RepID=A0A4Q2UQW7_9BACT|nr:translesion error-prone DNA polymerase V autoproteolytic subunit [Spirosoma sordidisoli]RYC70065.1 translesion error-prone DNA polymerase V autoproteolytic subunit [Spirosoma sordidisoli]
MTALRTQERLSVYDFARATVETRLRIPFFQSLVQAGFPSPAENYIDRVCDLNDLCITNAEATYFVRVTGDSMTGDRIEPGDILIVDCSQEATSGKIAVVWFNGEHTVKRIQYAHPLVVLLPSNPRYQPIYVQPNDDFRVFGVVTFVIQKTR